MHCEVSSSLCERCRDTYTACHTPMLPGDKPVQHVTVTGTVDSCHTAASVCVSQHRKGTVKYVLKDKKQ